MNETRWLCRNTKLNVMGELLEHGYMLLETSANEIIKNIVTKARVDAPSGSTFFYELSKKESISADKMIVAVRDGSSSSSSSASQVLIGGDARDALGVARGKTNVGPVSGFRVWIQVSDCLHAGWHVFLFLCLFCFHSPRVTHA